MTHYILPNAYAAVRTHITSAHQRNKEGYDNERPFSPYTVGDLVWLYLPAVKPGRTKKFASQWKGPYTVMDRNSEVNYRLKLVGSSAKSLVVHHNRLKSYYGTPQQVTPAPNRLLTPVNLAPTHLDLRTSSIIPAGGYTSSSTVPDDSSPPSSEIPAGSSSIVPDNHPWLHRRCGPTTWYADYVPP